MTRVHLVRHAAFDGVGRILAGRAPGVHLSAAGRAQAQRLAHALAHEPIAAVYTSPLERAQETAMILAGPHGVEPSLAPAFIEVDFGEWTGSDSHDLEVHSVWQDFNTLRSLTRIPGGEHMLETQTRAVAGLLELRHSHEGATIAIVSHADVIRAVLGHVLGMPMDYLLRLAIAPATYSTIELRGAWPQVMCIGRPAPSA